MHLKKLWLRVALISGISISLSVFGANNTINIEKPGSWVIDNVVSLPDVVPLDTVEGGVYYGLLDHQVKVAADTQPEFYTHFAELIVNQQGLESSSQINVVYAPSYETLTFNSLRLHRDGKVLDRLSSSRMSVIQREKDLENQLYDGRLTANIILDDVRVGDLVEYSYTIKGLNPVYKGIFSYEQSVKWSVPVHKQLIRVLWAKATPLHITNLNTDVLIKQSQSGKFTSYSLEVNDTKPLYVNTETPRWYNPFGMIFFSESRSWSEIALWAFPLYETAIDTGPEIRKVADSIANRYQNPEEQIVQALMFVQSEVRYLGIEIGSNSHMPSTSIDTLQRRYGDCKDKAVLFVSLLKALGVQASPALVNTDITKQLAEYPPTVDAFNHVLVKVLHGDISYWLDPTRQYQRGNLKDIYQPDYGYALVVDKQTASLEKMNDMASQSALIINDKFDLTQGTGKDVIFVSNTKYTGYEAEKMRYSIANSGKNGLQDKYLEFYTRFYSVVEPVEAIAITEDDVSGEVYLKEKYLLRKFWVMNENGKEYNGSFFANSITPLLETPEQIKRTSPYGLGHPVRIRQNIDVLFKTSEWSFDEDEVIEDNKYFYYKSNVKFDKTSRTLKISHEYETRTDHVNVEDFDAYLAAIKRAKKNAEYVIADYIKSTDAGYTESEIDIADILILATVVVYAGGIIFVIVNWRMDAKKQPEFQAAVFYPVSMVKMILLSFITFGIYVIYWFYRNWLYRKKQEQSTMMPLARGIFSIFWYYPLYKVLVKDSMVRYSENKVLVKPLAILFSILYVLVNFLGNADKLWIAMIVIMPLLLIPFANYINHINDGDSTAYNYNSRWLPRHTILALLMLPVFALAVGSELNIIPGDKVIEGDDVLDYHVKFMHRKGIFPPGEKIIYFYSDAFINMHDDGNGFTDNHVFSYWKDENGEFNFESETFSNIEKIDVKFSKNTTDNTVITLEKVTGGSIVLYVSHTEGLDARFVKELKSRWNASRKASGI